jgi:DNA-binding NtrC family response regulator
MAQILIIDDERSIRNVLKDILTNEGFKSRSSRWGRGFEEVSVPIRLI